MPNPFDQLISNLAGRIAQYPDEEVYRAITLLAPDERPHAPVRVMPVEQWPSFGNATPEALRRFRREIEGAVDLEQAPLAPGIPRTVYINPTSTPYRNGGSHLASLLAHEGVHAAEDGRGELEAYQKQIDVLKRLGFSDEQIMADLERRLLIHRLRKKG